MVKARVIPRLDVKGPNVIKGVQLECLRVVGQPAAMAQRYYQQGADELIYIDIVASLYGRQNLLDIVDKASDKVFIPFTVGGGVRSLEDVRAFLRSGADKVAINTAATKNPALLERAARTFGSQCIVASIEAKRTSDGWENFTDNGREPTGLDVIDWAQRVEELGAGEILLTSIDREGTRKGYDLELIQAVTKRVSIPVVACGGAGSIQDIHACLTEGDVGAVALSSLLHYEDLTLRDIKEALLQEGHDIRQAGK